MTARAFPSGTPAYLGFLPRFLFSSEGPRAGYVVKAWLLALLPSLLLASAITVAAPVSEAPNLPFSGARLVVLLVVVTPLLETLLMIPPLWALRRIAGPGAASVASALLWGVVHSLAVPVWGLVAWWPFLILSVALLTWRERGLVGAVVTVACIHALQNAVSLALPRLLGLAA